MTMSSSCEEARGEDVKAELGARSLDKARKKPERVRTELWASESDDEHRVGERKKKMKKSCASRVYVCGKNFYRQDRSIS